MTRTLVTGGCGFIGSNLMNRLLARGEDVVAFDNLSRRGSEKNAAWLESLYGDKFRVIRGDVRDADAIKAAARDADIIYHLAAQVAVTTSVTDPRTDFEINALGTFNTLEAARVAGRNPIFLYASTNKVYGAMEDLEIVELPTRYAYRDIQGFGEDQPLDFHSPYGCSKGAADQYVRDYSRIYGLRSVVLRQSAIYGIRQFGVEDQGWMAWFVIAAVLGRPITIYGDGKQVRDMLFVEDLIDAYDAAVVNIDRTAGHVYNMGGGPGRTISVWQEFAPRLAQLLGRPIPVAHGDWRPGDQKVCIYDVSQAERELGWKQKVGLDQGIEQLYRWVVENRPLFS
ncbi:MAG: SDR family NAD(P)-dependent oxidoreductase [Anaerolineae bacterium]